MGVRFVYIGIGLVNMGVRFVYMGTRFVNMGIRFVNIGGLLGTSCPGCAVGRGCPG